MKVSDDVDVQINATLVVSDGDGRVLLTRYNPTLEQWWLPGEDVEPFTHPDGQVTKVLAALGVTARTTEFKRVQSFCGRRGWHLVFDYQILADARTGPDAQWFAADDLPMMMHGDWEKSVVLDLLGG